MITTIITITITISVIAITQSPVYLLRVQSLGCVGCWVVGLRGVRSWASTMAIAETARMISTIIALLRLPFCLSLARFVEFTLCSCEL